MQRTQRLIYAQWGKGVERILLAAVNRIGQGHGDLLLFGERGQGRE